MAGSPSSQPLGVTSGLVTSVVRHAGATYLQPLCEWYAEYKHWNFFKYVKGLYFGSWWTPNVLFFIIPDFPGIVSPFEFVSSLCVPRILYLGYCHLAVKKKKNRELLLSSVNSVTLESTLILQKGRKADCFSLGVKVSFLPWFHFLFHSGFHSHFHSHFILESPVPWI